MHINQRNLAIIATLTAALLWSSGGLFIKLLSLDSFTILFYRSFYAAIIFVVIFGKRLFKFNKISLISTLFYAPLLISFVSATKLTTAANAIFLQYTAPAFILLLEPYFLRTKILKINVLTVGLCFLGLILFFMDDFSSPDDALGLILAVTGGIVLTGLLISQKLNHSDFHPGAIFWGNILVCVVTFPWFLESDYPSFYENNLLMLLGFGQLGLGFALFVYGQKYLPAIESSFIAMLEPILNPLWVVIGYGEKPGVWSLAGGTIIIITLMIRLYWTEIKVKRLT